MAETGEDSLEKIRRFLWYLFFLAVADMAFAAVLQLCGLVAMTLHGGCSLRGSPYNTGVFIATPFLVVSGISKGYIYVKGQTGVNDTRTAKNRIGNAVYTYDVIMIFTYFGLLSGMLVTGIIGVCDSTGCSFPTNKSGNTTMVAFMIFFLVLAFIGIFLSTLVVGIYSKYVGVSFPGRQPIPTINQVNPRRGGQVN